MSQLELRPGLADVPVAESAISFIDGKRARLEYRGIAVETLARESCFEETAWLLLKGDLPTQRELAGFDDQLRHHRRIKYKLLDLIKCLPETGHPMDALQAGVAAMGMFYPARDVSNAQSNWDAIAGKKKIMGFGHRVYKVKDPRATVLQELAENVFVETGRPQQYQMAMELERLATGMPNLGQKGVYPNVDFYSGIVYQALGIP